MSDDIIKIVDAAFTDGERQLGKRAEALWAKIRDGGHWQEWLPPGEHMMIARREIMRALHLNAPQGRSYNEAFSAWCAAHHYDRMDASVRSHLLFCLEPENRAILDRYLAPMPSSQRMKLNHPTTMAKKIKQWRKLGSAPEQEKPKRVSVYDQMAELKRENAGLQRRIDAEGSLFDIAKTPPDMIARITGEHVGLARTKAIRKAFDAWIVTAEKIMKRKAAKPAG